MSVVVLAAMSYVIPEFRVLSNFVQIGTHILRIVESFGEPLEIGQRTLAKSSITQPCIARLR